MNVLNAPPFALTNAAGARSRPAALLAIGRIVAIVSARSPLPRRPMRALPTVVAISAVNTKLLRRRSRALATVASSSAAI